MNITFNKINEKEIQIMSDDKVIGRIFSPSTSNGKNTIQICGFDEAFDLWGCGVFGKEYVGLLKESGLLWKAKKDIQLLFLEDEPSTRFWMDYIKRKLSNLENCLSCYSNPCVCENEIKQRIYKDDGLMENPFNVKRRKQIEHLLEK